MNLETLRGEIDAVDRQLLELLNKRTELSTAIGECKRLSGSPVFAPDREAALMRHLESINRGPMKKADLRAIYREILSASRACQKSPRIAVLESVPGTATLAARLRFGSSDIYLSCPEFSEMLALIETGFIETGLVSCEEFVRHWTANDGFLRESMGTKWHLAGDISSPALQPAPVAPYRGLRESGPLHEMGTSTAALINPTNCSIPVNWEADDAARDPQRYFLLGREPILQPNPARTVLLATGQARDISKAAIQLALRSANIKVVTAEPLKYSARAGEVCYHVAVEGVITAAAWAEVWHAEKQPTLTMDVVGAYSDAASYG